MVYGEHWFVLNEISGEGKEGRVVTEVVNGERIGGLLGGLVPEGVQKRLLESLEVFLGELKGRVESEMKEAEGER